METGRADTLRPSNRALMLRLWQLCIALLVVVGFASLGNGAFGRNDQGTFGFAFLGQPTLSASTVVTAVVPGSPAGRAGIHPGDRLQIAPTFANRIVLYATVPGDHIVVDDGERVIGLTASVSGAAPPTAFVAVVELARITFLVMAALVAWRRPDDPAARALALLLACFGVGITFDVGALSSVWTRFALLIFVQTLFLVGALAALAFAARFPVVAARGVRGWIDRSMPALAVAGVTLAVLTPVLLFTVPFAARRDRLALGLPFLLFYIAAIVGTFTALGEGYRTLGGADRVRARWALGTIVLGLSGLLVVLIVAAAGGPTATVQYFALTTLVIPFGLAYAIFRHRMLDITFVINRAIVYTGVSVVIVGSFIVFEWLLGAVVAQNSRASIVLQLLAALALGLSTRFIHGRVDNFVDNLFFRERRAAEAAVRRFAREAPLITATGDLVAKTVEVAQENMRLSGAAFYAQRDEAFVPLYSTIPGATAIVDENDYAVLEMRTWHVAVEPAARTSLLRGDVAFPMMVRGSLAGFLLCAEKETHEELAPDERDALAVLANSSGMALDSLRVRAVEAELKDLSRDASLPHPVRVKLSELAARPAADLT